MTVPAGKTRFRAAVTYAGVALLLLTFWVAADRSAKLNQSEQTLGLQVHLPSFVQVVLLGGDRYMAANIGVFRALVASSAVQSDDELVIQSAIQNDVSQLNPGHEDNYYLAAASLVGTPQHATGQQILLRASDARPFDFIPPFFYGVHRMHYEGEPVDGARWLQVAAARAQNETDRLGLEKTAIRWIQRGQDPAIAAAVLDAMAKDARNASLRQYISKRAGQAHGLADLRAAAEAYQARMGKPPASLEALVVAGTIKEIPSDPLGQGYMLDTMGRPVIRSKSVADRTPREQPTGAGK